jgi:hypothetical protein
MAGQRKNPTTGAVTVLKPTDRQTPKRAGGAAVSIPESLERLLGVGAGLLYLEQFPHCVESCEALFLKANRRGSHASGSLKGGLAPHYSCRLWRPLTGVSHHCSGLR